MSLFCCLLLSGEVGCCRLSGFSVASVMLDGLSPRETNEGGGGFLSQTKQPMMSSQKQRVLKGTGIAPPFVPSGLRIKGQQGMPIKSGHHSFLVVPLLSSRCPLDLFSILFSKQETRGPFWSADSHPYINRSYRSFLFDQVLSIQNLLDCVADKTTAQKSTFLFWPTGFNQDQDVRS